MEIQKENVIDINRKISLVISPLLGIISTNIRRVVFVWHIDVYEVHFVIAQEDAEDRELIDDYAIELEAKMDCPTDVFSHIQITKEPLPTVKFPQIVVFQRCEEGNAVPISDGIPVDQDINLKNLSAVIGNEKLWQQMFL